MPASRCRSAPAACTRRSLRSFLGRASASRFRRESTGSSSSASAPPIPRARWSKLAMNCAMSTLGAITGFSLGELAARRYVRTLALGIVAEVVDAARARGVTLEAVAGVRPDWLVRLPVPLAHAAVWLAARRRPEQKSGMIARLRQGRPAGIEDLNALIDAPLNNTLVRQVREIERGERRISPQNLSELL